MLVSARLPQRRTFSRRRDRGMSMIESLVAMLILAFGVLGMVGAQIRSMIESQNTAQITVASQLANDLFERIKTNPAAYSRYNADTRIAEPLRTEQWGWLASYTFTWGAAPLVPGTTCNTSPCNSAARAVWDVAQWKAELAARIPGSNSSVTVSPNDARQIIVIIGWPRKETASATPFTATIPGVALPADCSSTHSCYFAYGHP
ncbi:MAG: type IV pilus modification protein PilV [Rhodoferax sp.]